MISQAKCRKKSVPRNFAHFPSGFFRCKFWAQASPEKETLFTTMQAVILVNLSQKNSLIWFSLNTLLLDMLNPKSHQKNKTMLMDCGQLCLRTILSVCKLMSQLLSLCMDLYMCIGVLLLTGPVHSGLVARQYFPSHPADMNLATRRDYKILQMLQKTLDHSFLKCHHPNNIIRSVTALISV